MNTKQRHWINLKSLLLALFVSALMLGVESGGAMQYSCPPHYGGCAHEACTSFSNCKSVANGRYGSKRRTCDSNLVGDLNDCKRKYPAGGNQLEQCKTRAENRYQMCISQADINWCTDVKWCCSRWHAASGSCSSYDRSCPPFDCD